MPINPGIIRHVIRPHPTPPHPDAWGVPCPDFSQWVGGSATSRRGQDMVRLRIRYLGCAEARPWRGGRGGSGGG